MDAVGINLWSGLCVLLSKVYRITTASRRLPCPTQENQLMRFIFRSIAGALAGLGIHAVVTRFTGSQKDRKTDWLARWQSQEVSEGANLVISEGHWLKYMQFDIWSNDGETKRLSETDACKRQFSPVESARLQKQSFGWRRIHWKTRTQLAQLTFKKQRPSCTSPVPMLRTSNIWNFCHDVSWSRLRNVSATGGVFAGFPHHFNLVPPY